MGPAKLSAFLLLCLYFDVTFGGYVAVFGSRTIQHKTKYKVAFTGVDYYKKEKCVVSLVGDDVGEEFGDHRITLKPYHEQELEFDLSGSDVIQNYTLKVKVAADNFEQSVQVITLPKRYSVFIQTDKPLYKRNDTVNYRVLVIDSETKPVEFKSITVQVFDNLGERVKDSTKVLKRNKAGVYKDKFGISEEASKGKWRMNVVINKEANLATDHSFEVKEYVLPRFEVITETRRDVTLDENDISIKVGAKYTFGEFVEGTAVVTAQVFDPTYSAIIQQSVVKTIPVETFKSVSFDMKNDLKINNQIRPWQVKIKVEFTETLTGQKLTKEAEVRVFKVGEFTVRLVREQKRFKPGFPYKIQAVVQDFEGKIVHDKDVKLSVQFIYQPLLCEFKEEIKSLITTADFVTQAKIKNGAATFNLNITPNTTDIKVTAKYFEATDTLNIVSQRSNSDEYLFIKLLNEPKLGEPLKVEVRGNRDWDTGKNLFSTIIGRTGMAHFASHEDESDDGNSIEIEIVLNSAMAPESYLIVYYIQSQGEIVYDRIKLVFEFQSANEMNIKLSKSTVGPGENCRISVDTKPNSYVSLLAVDQSVILMGGGNDIDNARVAKDMEGYNAYKNNTKLIINGNSERYLELGESNAFVLTNALSGNSTCFLSPRFSEDKRPLVNERAGNQLDEDEVDKVVNDAPVREDFSEVWFFEDFSADKNGKYSFERKLPDTITSFIVTGFSSNPTTGLAIASQQKVKVFQEFFLSLYLPYSIRFGEVLKVDVTVFNYVAAKNFAKKNATVTVTLESPDGNFEFITATPSGSVCNFSPLAEDSQQKTIKVPHGKGAATFFLIRALETGQIKLRVQATTQKYKDIVEKTILVEHEGLTEYDNNAFLINLRDVPHYNHQIEKEFKTDYVKDSIYIEASVIGDLLGPALKNIHSLIRMPSGCTEQQFKSWIPNIAAIKYLKAIGKLTSDFEKNGETYLTTGYQQVQSRRKPDGSFSLWGEAGQQSVWLTAYVAKILAHAKEIISINDKHIVEALNYVKGKQNANGSFTDAVQTYYYISKTKTQVGVAYTAFVAIAFMENTAYLDKYKDVIDRAITYINSQAQKLEDNLSIAIAAYALAMRAHPAASGFLDDLMTNAFSANGKTYWYREKKEFVTSESPSINVEIAAYAIMAFCKAGRSNEAIPIMNWLVTQRNDAGGFYATTDTVVGLQALATMATIYNTKNINMDLKMSHEGTETNFNINPANALDLQYKELPKVTRKIQVHATGTGLAYLQVAYRYEVKTPNPGIDFLLTVEAQPSANANILLLKICASFIVTDEKDKTTMTLMEIFLPSGYVYDPETANLVKAAKVMKTETRNQNTIIVLYFDNITKDKICPQVKAIRKNVVGDLKDSAVKIYEYTNQNVRASAFYSAEGSKGKPCKSMV